MGMDKAAAGAYQIEKRVSGRRVGVLFYILIGYVLLQFIWWAYLLVDLNMAHYNHLGPDAVRMKVLMVAGEGAVFFIFLLAGVYIVHRTIRKEIELVKQQRNFLLSITHELKTPVSAIKLCLQTLVKRENLAKEQQLQLQFNAIENTERLHTLIDNVLLATRIESHIQFTKNEELDLTPLTKAVVERFKASLSENTELILESDNECIGKFDRSAYESVIVNLLENAIKYSNGGKVVVRLSLVDKEIILTVADSGPGIPDDEKPKVFGKFYRMGNEETRSKKGTGLGLYIVSELVNLLGGKLSLRDNTPSGSVFSVILPTSDQSR
jgi:signal transduction histidine kinase